MCPLPMTSFSEIPHERHRGPQPAVRLDQQDALAQPSKEDYNEGNKGTSLVHQRFASLSKSECLKFST